jgi:hypothetical protein
MQRLEQMPTSIAIQTIPESTEAHEHHLDDALDVQTIAELTSSDIERLNGDELVRVIRGAEFPDFSSPDFGDSLALYDLETLRRLAYRARNCCQVKFEAIGYATCDSLPSATGMYEY